MIALLALVCVAWFVVFLRGCKLGKDTDDQMEGFNHDA